VQNGHLSFVVLSTKMSACVTHVSTTAVCGRLHWAGCRTRTSPHDAHTCLVVYIWLHVCLALPEAPWNRDRCAHDGRCICKCGVMPWHVTIDIHHAGHHVGLKRLTVVLNLLRSLRRARCNRRRVRRHNWLLNGPGDCALQAYGAAEHRPNRAGCCLPVAPSSSRV
jgi:hypothetical protein